MFLYVCELINNVANLCTKGYTNAYLDSDVSIFCISTDIKTDTNNQNTTLQRISTPSGDSRSLYISEEVHKEKRINNIFGLY